MHVKVRALFRRVVETVERIERDLRERPGIGAETPDLPAIRGECAEDDDVRGKGDYDASQGLLR
jgi:hypothetical protein